MHNHKVHFIFKCGEMKKTYFSPHVHAVVRSNKIYNINIQDLIIFLKTWISKTLINIYFEGFRQLKIYIIFPKM